MKNLICSLPSVLCASLLARLPAAQIPAPGPGELYSFFGIIGSIAGFVVLCLAGLAYWKKIRETRPLEIKSVSDLATVRQLQTSEAELKKLMEKHAETVEERFRDVFRLVREEGTRVDSRVNSLAERVAEFIGRFDQSQKRRANHD